jgi:hypothetical protein
MQSVVRVMSADKDLIKEKKVKLGSWGGGGGDGGSLGAGRDTGEFNRICIRGSKFLYSLCTVPEGKGECLKEKHKDGHRCINIIHYPLNPGGVSCREVSKRFFRSLNFLALRKSKPNIYTVLCHTQQYLIWCILTGKE